MWMTRTDYDRHYRALSELERALSASEGIRQTYSEQNKVLQVNLDWLRVRVNQLEHERAQLLFNYTGVKIAVPQIQVDSGEPVHPLAELPSFSDIGDEEAKKQGMSWDAEGHVV